MITSAANRQIKELTALVRKPKERKKQKVFVVEGPRMCFEAPVGWVKAIYVSESFLADEGQRRELEQYMGQENNSGKKELSYEILSDSVFKAVSDTQTPQGILAVVRQPEYQISDLLCGERTQLLILESIQDPGNLGTMLRTGEGAGVTGVIMNRTTVDLFNPKTIRSTMGSIYRIPFLVAEDLPGLLKLLREQGIHLYAAHLDGSCLYDEPDYTKPSGFLIGNEGNGLTEELAGLADTYIRIPMEGKVESLNAAISATLLMYECNRQRRKG